MNLKSKIAALSAVAVLTITFAGHSFAATNAFTDLENVSSKDIIIELQDKGFVKGVGNDLFAPSATLTAAQGIQLIVNVLDLNLDLIRFFKEPLATDYFKNADNDAWYANALIIASVMSMELPADLDPNQQWTREEFTHYLVRTMESHNNLPKIKIVAAQVKDGDEITPDYSGAIQRGLHYGIVQLDADGKFNPKDHLSRADAAGEIYKAMKYLEAHVAPVVETKEGL
ncbi:MAG: S-layer homology domain-containing protein [Vallitaleaceae bacterium]|nr:S-layer homology domain-containing protein [Vallitaleaceae bacterium]